MAVANHHAEEHVGANSEALKSLQARRLMPAESLNFACIDTTNEVHGAAPNRPGPSKTTSHCSLDVPAVSLNYSLGEKEKNMIADSPSRPSPVVGTKRTREKSPSPAAADYSDWEERPLKSPRRVRSQLEPTATTPKRSRKNRVAKRTDSAPSRHRPSRSSTDTGSASPSSSPGAATLLGSPASNSGKLKLSTSRDFDEPSPPPKRPRHSAPSIESHDSSSATSRDSGIKIRFNLVSRTATAVIPSDEFSDSDSDFLRAKMIAPEPQDEFSGLPARLRRIARLYNSA
ncbi:hypothetical protein CYLTODRAFT_485328 [Cylindrobasidium torrendii FP15055 ss-10]|uniref:Uncharacterized protein n=1 Tax=Cylindrobasidium torrendii FP15055 ss-10 TaxID=1314674 RepID=A0A0D7BT91_9AGAR|nr:hypothetical protein CYLTODRAFT_485328 [Cylindrobasidium torrendii FP15055 ss-10]